eukprot:3793716-Amphidinium_carterae.2
MDGGCTQTLRHQESSDCRALHGRNGDLAACREQQGEHRPVVHYWWLATDWPGSTRNLSMTKPER